DRGHHDLGDRLRRARSDLAEPLPPGDRRNLDRPEKLVRPPDTLTVTRVEGSESNAALFGRALKHETRLGHGEHRQSITGRRGIDHIASDRAAVLNLNAAALASRSGENRNSPANERRTNQVGIGRERADRENVPAHRYASQGIEIPEIQKALCWE